VTNSIAVKVAEGSQPPQVWLDLLTAADAVSFFHEELWVRAVSSHMPAITGQWLIARNEGRVVGGLALTRRTKGPLHAWEGHHAGTPGWPVLIAGLPADIQAETLHALLEASTTLGRGPRSLGLGLTLPPAWDQRLAPTLSALGFQRSPVHAAVLPLIGGLDHVEMHVLKKNRRNERNRSLKAGCVASCREDTTDLSEFHAIYRTACQGWGVPPVPEELCADLLTDGSGKVFLTAIHFEGQLIGGHLCLRDGDMVTAWLGATSADHKHLFPSTVLIWTDIQEACRRGAAWLDLGGHGGQAGVANFKKLLGAETIERGLWQVAPTTTRILRGAVDRLRRRGGA
jgi:CelD/BcsL family acetyltransferase involved in cellulose biosynthesis